MYCASSSTRSILSKVVCVNFMCSKFSAFWSYTLARHPDHGDDHLFQAYATVLKGIPIIVDIVIVVIRITEKSVPPCEDERRVHRGYRQTGLLRVAKGEYLFCFVIKVAAMFVEQVRGRLLVPDHLIRCLYANAAMVRRQHEVHLFVGDLLQRGMQRAMLEPAGRDAPVADLVAGQLFQHLHFGTRVAEHVHKVVDDDIDIVVEEVVDVIDQVLARLVVDNLCIGEFQLVFLQPAQLSPEELFLEEVLAAFLIIVFPLIGELFLDIQRHQARKDSVPAVLCGGGQDAVETIFLQSAKAFSKDGLDGLPLVDTQVVQQNKKRGDALFDMRQHFELEQGMRQ